MSSFANDAQVTYAFKLILNVIKKENKWIVNDFIVVVHWTVQFYCAGWLVRVDDDATKAVCLVCDVVLRAHYRDIERHSTTAKHLRNMTASDAGSALMRYTRFNLLNYYKW